MPPPPIIVTLMMLPITVALNDATDARRKNPAAPSTAKPETSTPATSTALFTSATVASVTSARLPRSRDEAATPSTPRASKSPRTRMVVPLMAAASRDPNVTVAPVSTMMESSLMGSPAAMAPSATATVACPTTLKLVRAARSCSARARASTVALVMTPMPAIPQPPALRGKRATRSSVTLTVAPWRTTATAPLIDIEEPGPYDPTPPTADTPKPPRTTTTLPPDTLTARSAATTALAAAAPSSKATEATREAWCCPV
mmetsp:Transcript_10039/g.30942  ORF Transcript_10039/g.30942 Transcript_10039/m.30942 type:complete len:258 (+) Transcript_10039:137-910(+)